MDWAMFLVGEHGAAMMGEEAVVGAETAVAQEERVEVMVGESDCIIEECISQVDVLAPSSDQEESGLKKAEQIRGKGAADSAACEAELMGRAHRHEDPEVEPQLTNASSVAQCFSYQLLLGAVHCKYDCIIGVVGVSLVFDGHKVDLSLARRPAETPVRARRRVRLRVHRCVPHDRGERRA